jgi:transcriptional regulator with XRE-family HTH domain
MSQHDLAYACRLPRTETSLFERGVRDPRLSTVVRLAAGLETTTAALLEGVEAA